MKPMTTLEAGAGPLRVVFADSAFADLIVLARTSLDAEICGVLVGEVDRSSDESEVKIEAILPGEQARETSTQVTFTQETWNTIHDSLERRYPGASIVGWYHTHPGFGVEFSEMDRFVHHNFFPSFDQVALVTDPLSGEIAMLRNTDHGTTDLPRFWVGHREIRCRQLTPASTPASTPGSRLDTPPSPGDPELRDRLDLLLGRVEEQRQELFQWLGILGAVIAVALLVWIGASIHRAFFTDARVANLLDHGTAPMVLELEEATVVLDAQIVGVEIPRPLRAPVAAPTVPMEPSADPVGIESGVVDPFAEVDGLGESRKVRWGPRMVATLVAGVLLLGVLVLSGRAR